LFIGKDNGVKVFPGTVILSYSPVNDIKDFVNAQLVTLFLPLVKSAACFPGQLVRLEETCSRMKLFFVVTFICLTRIAFAQTDSSSLLKETETKLQNNNGTVSSILSDKKYMAIHPLTSFREVVRKHAAADVVRIAPEGEPGKKIKVVALIKNKDGEPVPDALVYFYQTDARGWYAADAPHILINEGDMRHARLFGYVKTDKNGRIEIHTIKPSGYPNSDLPAHIHVHVSAAGYQPYGTEFLFRDDERLKGEILNRAVVDGGMIANPETADAPFDQQFSYEIKLRK